MLAAAALLATLRASAQPSLCSLLEHCRKHKFLAAPGEVFALLVSSLLENLLDYRTIMHDESKENRMSCTVNLLVWARLPLQRGAAQLPWLLGALRH